MIDKARMNPFAFFTHSLRRKVLASITLVLVVGLAAVVWISTDLQVKDSRSFVLKNASDNAKSMSELFRQEIQQALNRGRSWALQSLKGADLKTLSAGDESIQGVEIFTREGQLVSSSLDERAPKSLKLSDVEWQSLKGTEILYRRGTAFHEVIAPLLSGDGDNADGLSRVLVLYLQPQVIEAALKGDGFNQSFLFNKRGEIFFKSASVPSESLSATTQMPASIVDAADGSPLTNAQISVADPKGLNFIGSYFKTGVGDLSVAVFANEERVFDTPRKVALRSTYLGLAILCVALVLGVFFADSLVQPILSLVEATRKVSQGDFSVRSKASTHDELATLTESFNGMTEGLAERERIKAVFGKFHSKAVFQKLLKEDRIKLGGERIPVTVFFSDIRSFTSRAEQMSPEQVVEMLNEYMTEMVAVIEKHGGVVDKYVGDAIMAIWGMPEAAPATDAANALAACLEMRMRLEELNQRRLGRGQSAIEIGMGLNSGEVIAGNIGSPSRMEYTVIGDTVNTASRMESLTKEFKTDLLINESTVKLIAHGDHFDWQGPFEASAKGKSEKIRVYGCGGVHMNDLKKAA